MLVRLTYYQTGKQTIVNLNDIRNAHRVFDKERDKWITKLTYRNGGDFINVTETLEEIYKIQMDLKDGVYQLDGWEEDPDYRPIERNLRYGYQGRQENKRFVSGGYRSAEKNFNSSEAYNENRF